MTDSDPVEELRRANRELLALYDINRLLQTPLSTEEKLYIILTSLTADDAFGYSRAYLLLANKQAGTLEGWLGVGPLSGDDAREIWENVTSLEDDDTGGGWRNIAALLNRASFDIKVKDFVASVANGQGHPIQTVITRRPSLVKGDSSRELHPEFAKFVSSPEVAFIPLLAKRRVMGVIAVESQGHECAINDERLKTLTIFGNLAAIALENSRLYRALEEKVHNLETVNKELREAQAKILKLDRLATMGAIAAGVAHEIRNPLNSLTLNIHLLKEEIPDLSSEAKRLVGVVESETARLGETVAEFLGYSKAPKLDLTVAHPHKVIDQVLEMVEFQGRAMGVQIIREYGEGVSETTMDEKRMKQAILNVVTNALQAMPGGGTLRVRTGMNKGSDGATMSGHFFMEITDTGRGIPEDSMDRLFDPFYTTTEEGAGMGLPIVDSILRLHGGRVNIKSIPGRGTTVTLCIPTATAKVNGK